MSEIQRFYSGQNIFITGGTGFTGKILVEKLLRSCPEIGTIYLLIRPKKGKTTQERLNLMTSLGMFEPLREKNPNFEKKIVPLTGDAVKPGLGLSFADRELIIKEVSVIFHVAATTKFDEPLKVAVDINVNSVMALIDISKKCKKLKAAVYVSTAFSNCIYDHIEEKIYPTPMKYEDLNNIIKIMEYRNFSAEEEIDFTNSLLGKFPNTYAFTKAVAENMINEYAKDIPFCVFRFSIALATFREPVPGWVDIAQGLNQALIGIGIGAIRAVCVKADAKMDLIPVDFAANGLIASAWETSTTQRSTNKDVRVYNYVSGADNPLTWTDFRETLRIYGPNNAPKSIIYYPDTLFIESKKLYAVVHFLLHLIPALLGDVVLRLLGKKPILHKIYKKGTKLLESVRFFMGRNWVFDTGNVRSMWNKLSESDKVLFNFDITCFEWRDAIYANCDGVIRYIMKEDTSPEARKIAQRKFKILHNVHRIVRLIFYAFVLWLIWKIYCVLFNRQ